MKILSLEERALFSAAVDEAYARADSTPERADVLLGILRDAEQAHEPFAIHALQACLERGVSAEMTADKKRRSRVAVITHDGRLISKPAVIGLKRRASDGQTFDVQALFHTAEWDELREKKRAYLIQRQAYDDDVAVIDRLLTLEELAPGAVNPVDAARRLGTTVEAWLLGEALAA